MSSKGRDNLENHLSSLGSCEEVAQEDLREYDILLGRSRRSKMHIGNVAFRTLVASRVELYKNSSTRSQRISIVVSLRNSVYESGGRFLNRRDNNTLVEVGQTYAREKIGNAIRDAIKPRNRGKTPRLAPVKSENFNQTTSFAEIVHFLVLDTEGGGRRSSPRQHLMPLCCARNEPRRKNTLLPLPSLGMTFSEKAPILEGVIPEKYDQTPTTPPSTEPPRLPVPVLTQHAVVNRQNTEERRSDAASTSTLALDEHPTVPSGERTTKVLDIFSSLIKRPGDNRLDGLEIDDFDDSSSHSLVRDEAFEDDEDSINFEEHLFSVV